MGEESDLDMEAFVFPSNMLPLLVDDTPLVPQDEPTFESISIRFAKEMTSL